MQRTSPEETGGTPFESAVEDQDGSYRESNREPDQESNLDQASGSNENKDTPYRGQFSGAIPKKHLFKGFGPNKSDLMGATTIREWERGFMAEVEVSIIQ